MTEGKAEMVPPDGDGGDASKEDKSLLLSFAMETTAHGVVKVATARNKLKRVFWIIALFGAFLLSAIMIGLRFRAYFSYSTVVEYNREYSSELTFPAVTFCNFNKLSKSYMEGENGKALSFLNDILSESQYGNEGSNGCVCGEDEFRCVADFETCCIPLSWECDSVTDCMDNSDETAACSLTSFSNIPTTPADFVEICSTDVLSAQSTTENANGETRYGGWLMTMEFGTTQYNHNLRCSKEIPMRNEEYLIINIWFSIEEAISCIYDMLQVGASRYCGSGEHHIVYKLEIPQSVPVQFISDHVVHDAGFLLQWYYSDSDEGGDVSILREACFLNVTESFAKPNFDVQPPVEAFYAVSICNDTTLNSTTINSTEGWISSYKFGEELYSESNCSLNIYHHNMTYMIANLWVMLETSPGCIYDKLSIGSLDLCGVLEMKVAIEVSTVRQDDIIPTQFIADSDVDDVGFSLNWHFSDNAEGLDVIHGDCELQLKFPHNTGQPSSSTVLSPVIDICDHISSPYPVSSTWNTWLLVSHQDYMNATHQQNYDHNLNCSITFENEGTGDVYLNFQEIGIDGTAGNCTSDYVTIAVDGGAEETYCGLVVTPINTTVSPNERFTVTFITDGSASHVGFSLVVRTDIRTVTTPSFLTSTDETFMTGSTTESTPFASSTNPGNIIGRRRRRSPGSNYQQDEVSPFNHLKPAHTNIDVFNVIRSRRDVEKRKFKHGKTDEDTKKDTGTQQSLDLTETKFSTMVLEGGWQLVDGKTLLDCNFRGVRCNSKWFKHEFTRFGNCYTFNSEHWLNDTGVDIGRLKLPLEQIQAGPGHGLSVKLDIQRDEYAEDLDTGYPQVGVKFQVHTPVTPPDVENQGLAIGTGQHGYAGFSETKVHNIIPPWGKCNKDIQLDWSDVYSFEQCAVECKLGYVVEVCGCKPFYYPGTAPECTAVQLKNCALAAIAEMDHGKFADYCTCPASCEYEDIDMKLSYTEFGSAGTTATEMNKKYYNITDGDPDYNGTVPDAEFYRNNIVSMDIYFDQMSYTVLQQLKAMDESSLLSDLGGQLGLFIGVSVLTICEMLETIVMGCYKCYNKRREPKVDKGHWASSRKNISVAPDLIKKDNYVISMA